MCATVNSRADIGGGGTPCKWSYASGQFASVGCFVYLSLIWPQINIVDLAI